MSRTHTDLSTVQISAAPSPATSGTSLGVSDANAALLPDIYPWWGLLRPHNAKPTRSNSEIVKVTAGSSSGGTTTYTIVRAQGIPVTTAQSPEIGWDLSEVHTAQKQIDTEQPLGSIFRQALVNPNCQVNQLITAVNLTSGKLFGPVDMFYAKGAGTAINAGTITQSTSANVGNSGYALLLSGVTLTGTGKTHVYTFIESLNAKLYKNKTASFSVKVYHDVGSAINYVIKINKANSADNFSAITNIATANAQSVPNTTETLIKFENVSLGDCSNGIEIEVEADCGAITTKNFQYTDWQFNEGSVVLPFTCKGFEKELIDCMRIVEKSFEYATTPGNSTYNTPGAINFGGFVAAGRCAVTSYFKVRKRTIPVITTYNGNASSSGTSNMVYQEIQLGVGLNNLTNGGVYPGENSFVLESNGLSANYNGICYGWVANARPTIA